MQVRPFDLAFYEGPFLLFILKINYIVINVGHIYFSEVRIDIIKLQYEEQVYFVIPNFGEHFLILQYLSNGLCILV